MNMAGMGWSDWKPWRRSETGRAGRPTLVLRPARTMEAPEDARDPWVW